MRKAGKIKMVSDPVEKLLEGKEVTDSSARVNLSPQLGEIDIERLPEVSLPLPLANRLMGHQKVGVRWLYSLNMSNSGGILGDDMGLGKTFQVLCLLVHLMQLQMVKRILILAPVSVLLNWEREAEEHVAPYIRGLQIHLINSDMSKKKRVEILDKVFSSSMNYSPKVVISSYQLVSNMIEAFAERSRWDYVILDEGHTIKNPATKTSKCMHLLPSHHRLILTGTPIQNNLNEFHALLTWVTKGKQFGTLNAFKEDFSNPIVAGQDPKATTEDRRIAEEAAKNLLQLIRPIILQRKKCELPSSDVKDLPEKIEMVVWVPLATSQRELYAKFIGSRAFSEALCRKNCPVEVINHLKMVCRHPLLIEAMERNKQRREATKAINDRAATHSKTPVKGVSRARDDEVDELSDDDYHEIAGGGGGDDEVSDLMQNLQGLQLDEDDAAGNAAAKGATGSADFELSKSLPGNATVFDVVQRDPESVELLRGSIKLRVLLKLAHRLHYAGHRTLIFSQSKLMLDIIQRVFAEYGLATSRIDGSVSYSERQRVIDEFNDVGEESDGISPTICLLTTRACGFGITLTGADRVIIYDPSWNPAEDRQAVDRAYRIGQTRPVIVYRLIMASAVEEKMYEKQVFKDGLRLVTESGSSSWRYFSKKETSELFQLGPVDQCVVMEKLWAAAAAAMGKRDFRIDEFTDTGGALPSVLGYSRHDNLYQEIRPSMLKHSKSSCSGATDGIIGTQQQQASDFQRADLTEDEEDDILHAVPPTPHPKKKKNVPTSSGAPPSINPHNGPHEQPKTVFSTKPISTYFTKTNERSREDECIGLTQGSSSPEKYFKVHSSARSPALVEEGPFTSPRQSTSGSLMADKTSPTRSHTTPSPKVEYMQPPEDTHLGEDGQPDDTSENYALEEEFFLESDPITDVSDLTCDTTPFGGGKRSSRGSQLTPSESARPPIEEQSDGRVVTPTLIRSVIPPLLDESSEAEAHACSAGECLSEEGGEIEINHEEYESLRSGKSPQRHEPAEGSQLSAWDEVTVEFVHCDELLDKEDPSFQVEEPTTVAENSDDTVAVDETLYGDIPPYVPDENSDDVVQAENGGSDDATKYMEESFDEDDGSNAHVLLHDLQVLGAKSKSLLFSPPRPTSSKIHASSNPLLEGYGSSENPAIEVDDLASGMSSNPQFSFVPTTTINAISAAADLQNERSEFSQPDLFASPMPGLATTSVTPLTAPSARTPANHQQQQQQQQQQTFPTTPLAVNITARKPRRTQTVRKSTLKATGGEEGVQQEEDSAPSYQRTLFDEIGSPSWYACMDDGEEYTSPSATYENSCGGDNTRRSKMFRQSLAAVANESLVGFLNEEVVNNKDEGDGGGEVGGCNLVATPLSAENYGEVRHSRAKVEKCPAINIVVTPSKSEAVIATPTVSTIAAVSTDRVTVMSPSFIPSLATPDNPTAMGAIRTPMATFAPSSIIIKVQSVVDGKKKFDSFYADEEDDDDQQIEEIDKTLKCESTFEESRPAESLDPERPSSLGDNHPVPSPCKSSQSQRVSIEQQESPSTVASMNNWDNTDVLNQSPASTTNSDLRSVVGDMKLHLLRVSEDSSQVQADVAALAAHRASLCSATPAGELKLLIKRPRASLVERDIQRYNSLTSAAYLAELAGDVVGAAESYRDALVICDEDACLHGKLALLLQELQL